MQILLNNLLYDVSEIPLPLDRVDAEEMARPRRWDMGFIRNFMLAIGPISSLFDFFTFYLLIAVLAANEALFRTGWFVESIATQVLAIFVIRTRRNPWRSRPHPVLALTSLGVVGLAMMRPYTAAGRTAGLLAAAAAVLRAAGRPVRRLSVPGRASQAPLLPSLGDGVSTAAVRGPRGAKMR